MRPRTQAKSVALASRRSWPQAGGWAAASPWRDRLANTLWPVRSPDTAVQREEGHRRWGPVSCSLLFHVCCFGCSQKPGPSSHPEDHPFPPRPLRFPARRQEGVEGSSFPKTPCSGAVGGNDGLSTPRPLRGFGAGGLRAQPLTVPSLSPRPRRQPVLPLARSQHCAAFADFPVGLRSGAGLGFAGLAFFLKIHSHILDITHLF